MEEGGGVKKTSEIISIHRSWFKSSDKTKTQLLKSVCEKQRGDMDLLTRVIRK